MERVFNKTKIVLKQGDITHEKVDVIVNAANSGLMGGGGVDGAIHRAGGPSILEECKKIRETQGRCPPGEAVITTAGNLHASYVVHTVGPIWHGGSKHEEEILRSAYSNSLKVALERKAKTIAFPSISTGAYGYPIQLAAPIALNTAREFIMHHQGIDEIRFVLFSDIDYRAYEDALKQLSFTDF